MKKTATIALLSMFLALFNLNASYAIDTNAPVRGDITLKSTCAAALSLFIWPGLGQAINDQPEDKVITHAVLGFLVIPRFWSTYDALVDRDGGYWKGRI